MFYCDYINTTKIFNHVYATIANSYQEDDFTHYTINVLSSLLGKDKELSSKIDVQTLLNVYFHQKRLRRDLLPITTACATVASDLPSTRTHLFSQG